MAAKFGVLALVEAKAGKEQDVWDFLNGGREIVLNEPGTRTWYAFRVNENTFGIFDTFDTEEDRRPTSAAPSPPPSANTAPPCSPRIPTSS